PARFPGKNKARPAATGSTKRSRARARRPAGTPVALDGEVELGQQGFLVGGEPAPRREEVGTPVEGAGDRLGPAPPGDAAVVAQAQDLGHGPPAELSRSGILRVLQQA